MPWRNAVTNLMARMKQYSFPTPGTARHSPKQSQSMRRFLWIWLQVCLFRTTEMGFIKECFVYRSVTDFFGRRTRQADGGERYSSACRGGPAFRTIKRTVNATQSSYLPGNLGIWHFVAFRKRNPVSQVWEQQPEGFIGRPLVGMALFALSIGVPRSSQVISFQFWLWHL